MKVEDVNSSRILSALRIDFMETKLFPRDGKVFLQQQYCSVARRQSSHNLLRHRVRARGDLLRRLVLNGMLHVNGIKARASQRAGLHSRRSRELCGGDRDCGHAEIL